MQTSTNQNSTHISGAPLTTTLSQEHAPGLLLNTIDQRIVKIRPMATPIDQISRSGAVRPASSLKVEYYAVGTKEVCSTTFRVIGPAVKDMPLGADTPAFNLTVTDPSLFTPTETVLLPQVPSVEGQPDAPALTCYIARIAGKNLVAIPLNATCDGTRFSFPEIEAGQKVIRMGRAASELDVQTPQHEALPRKSANYCQIFKMQIEQSTFQRLANKEANWTFSDIEENAVIEMRQGMEKNFLFGTPAQIFDPDKGEHITLTGGIWNQCQRTHTMPRQGLDNTHLVELCRKAFTGTAAGRGKKILIAGTGFIQALSNIEAVRNQPAGQTLTRFGIEFSEIRTNFGSLYVIASEIFDQCQHHDHGIIIDPEFLTKYVHTPFNAQKLDLRTSGQRNSDAVVLTEASCLVLRHPDAHLKVQLV